jgi:hypothetical protein
MDGRTRFGNAFSSSGGLGREGDLENLAREKEVRGGGSERAIYMRK